MNQIFIKCFLGQIMSLLLSTAVVSTHYLKSKIEISPFALLGLAYIVIHIFSQIIYYLSKTKYKINNKNILYIIVIGMTDFIGGFCLIKGLMKMSSYLGILIAQMVYPMSVFTDAFILKQSKVDFKMLSIFMAFVSVCFVVNYKADESDLKFDFIGMCLVLLSDILYMANGTIQSLIIPSIGVYNVLRYFTIVSFIFGAVMTKILDKEMIWNLKELGNFYVSNFNNVFSYIFAFCSYYLMASEYIGKYGIFAFNASIMSYSIYFGILTMIIDLKIRYVVAIGGPLCIIINVILVMKSKDPRKEVSKKVGDIFDKKINFNCDV
ncbi:hypothetical protein CWI38_0877p0030 [Hamiltosporidium tvaerminnensis]|uniref:Uncharacterized protein n=2 Tax=Hamiltosporidium TaxID=1176354 RepID=A0A4Q9L101_9MICR|nr:hypothetical protein LUQ84_002974 [Hamiltosporidium tvaerminnensis]TBU00655.1 hypothetical protein CWI37_0937p0020 [Hamiltosporidium tvaerminnensis]TBU12153.1 hypothetical protein CWI38_0877p0030 [Hamiltosporidium tvaerminnensis]